jgi:hypothetical protein
MYKGRAPFCAHGLTAPPLYAAQTRRHPFRRADPPPPPFGGADPPPLPPPPASSATCWGDPAADTIPAGAAEQRFFSTLSVSLKGGSARGSSGGQS